MKYFFIHNIKMNIFYAHATYMIFVINILYTSNNIKHPLYQNSFTPKKSGLWDCKQKSTSQWPRCRFFGGQNPEVISVVFWLVWVALGIAIHGYSMIFPSGSPRRLLLTPVWIPVRYRKVVPLFAGDPRAFSLLD